MHALTNPLLHTDVYKMGHMEQYKPGTTFVYSNLIPRSSKKYLEIVNFGHQYYAKLLTQPITHAMVDEFLDLRGSILGGPASDAIYKKLYSLAKLGYLPLQIKALPEGTVIPPGNVLASYRNTHPDFYWVVGFFESLLLKVWNTCTVATYSRELKELVTKYGTLTCDSLQHIPYSVHDFGYRGCSSEETAALSGAAHLLNFLGTDTVLAVKLLKDYYMGIDPVGLSIPASEHSVMCSFGPHDELGAFNHMLDTYPTGPVSIVSDTYNLWRVLSQYTDLLRDKIMQPNRKVIFRPDSGDQVKILFGDPDGTTPEEKAGVFNILWNKFGGTINSKNCRVLDPHVGVVYGDGFYKERFIQVFEKMRSLEWATSNLVVGVGGLLLQQHNRDDAGFSIKATYSEVNGQSQELYKDPITDPGKKSLTGLCRVEKHWGHGAEYYATDDQQTKEQEEKGLLHRIYEDGKMMHLETLQNIRYKLWGKEWLN